MTSDKKTGDFGEDLAEDLLRLNDYQILFRNWRKGKMEIDIVAKRDNMLVFVEVKTRTGEIKRVEDVFGLKKADSMLKAVNLYLKENEETDCRLDLILIDKVNEEYNIQHIEDAVAMS